MEMVARIARERRVETMVENIAKRPLSADLEDLSQMVYVILLEYDETKLQDLWEHGQINFFIARIILNQYRSVNSPFHKLFRKYGRLQENIESVRETGTGVPGL
jgi:hypothetical protein